MNQETRQCQNCKKNFVKDFVIEPDDFAYAPEGPEIVYCEKCYQQEVV